MSLCGNYCQSIKQMLEFCIIEISNLYYTGHTDHFNLFIFMPLPGTDDS